MRKTIAAACAIVTLTSASTLGGAPALARPWHDHWRHHHHHWHHHHWDHHHWRHHDDATAALAGGALGFVLGTAIADSQAHRSYAREHLHDQAWLNRCEARYKSFDPGSGTYLGFDGKRHFCQ